MTTTMHDTTLGWQDCPVCARLQRALELARVERERAWSALCGVDLQFREAMDAGRAYIGTDAWRRWRDLLDSLTLQDDRAAEHLQAALAAWGESIRKHATPQPMEDEGPDGTGETPTIAHDDDHMPCTADLGSDHCDACESLHEEEDEPLYLCGSFINARAEKEDETARELFGELRYGDVPDFDLPDDFEDGSWVSLHSASVAVRVYMILLERYAPRAAKGYPAWVANRLRDVLDEAAIQRAITDQGGRK